MKEKDQAQLAITITAEDGFVFVDFGRRIAWVGFQKEDAISFGNHLIQAANELKSKPKERLQ